jgi:hypothetical protein
MGDVLADYIALECSGISMIKGREIIFQQGSVETSSMRMTMFLHGSRFYMINNNVMPRFLPMTICSVESL